MTEIIIVILIAFFALIAIGAAYEKEMERRTRRKLKRKLNQKEPFEYRPLENQK